MVTTLVEFAIVLFLKRKVESINGNSKIPALNYEIDYLNQIYRTPMKEGDIESKNASNPEIIRNVTNVTPNTRSFNNVKNGLCTNTSLSTRIDMIAFWLFTLAYLMFNILYWNIYPN